MFSSPECLQMSQYSRRSIFQSPTDRKQALKTVLVKTQNLCEHPNLNTLGTLENVFKEADEIYDDVPLEEKIVNQDEVVLDSEVMSVSSRVIKNCGQAFIKQCSGFNANDFAENLLRFINYLPNASIAEPNWSILECQIPQFQTTANFICLLNNLHRFKKKSQKQIKLERMLSIKHRISQRIKLESCNLIKPEKVTQVKQEEKNLEQTVRLIKKVIRRSCKREGKPLNYFRLVLNPHDFGKTIENMLHVALLCKDGMIETATDDDLNLVVSPLSEEINKMTNKNYHQNIIHLDMDTWKFLKETMQITDPMIPSINF